MTPLWPWDRCAVINLATRTDRLTRFAEQATFVGLDYEVFEGVEATPGQAGCMESHHLVLSSAAEGETLAVFEDDALFCAKFHTRLAAFVASVPDTWEVLWLGGTHGEHPLPVCPGVVSPVRAYRSHAYVARGAGIARLVEVSHGQPPHRHFDHVAAQASPPNVTFAPDPWLVGQSAGLSDINLTPCVERWS